MPSRRPNPPLRPVYGSLSQRADLADGFPDQGLLVGEIGQILPKQRQGAHGCGGVGIDVLGQSACGRASRSHSLISQKKRAAVGAAAPLASALALAPSIYRSHPQ